MSKPRRKRNRKKIAKRIEIKSNKYGWTQVLYLGRTKSGKMIIKFKDGTIAKRKPSKVRFYVSKRVRSKAEYSQMVKSFGKKFKTRKKMHKIKSKYSRKSSLKSNLRPKQRKMSFKQMVARVRASWKKGDIT